MGDSECQRRIIKVKIIAITERIPCKLEKYNLYYLQFTEK